MWPRSWLKGQGSELGMQADGTGPRPGKQYSHEVVSTQ